MRTQLCVGMTSLLICGLAAAQSNLPSVEVRADSRESVEVSCANPASVKAQDVERVLSMQAASLTHGMRKKFISAATDACKAGIPRILVTKDAGELKWKQID